MSFLSTCKASLGLAKAPTPWGDGLVDLSIHSLWYGCRWDNVTDDELVFFYPSLSSQVRMADPAVGPAARIRKQMVPTAVSILRQLESCNRQKEHPSYALELLHRSRAAAILLSAEKADEIDGWEEKSLNEFCLVDALCQLATMDRMLHEALPAMNQSEKPLLESMALPDVLLATIHTKMNGAYLYPDTAYAHELLMLGAWLGTVLAGRPALMPTTVAEVMIDYLAGGIPDHDDSQRRIRKILNVYAGRAGGRDLLLRTVRKTLARGPQILRPSRHSGEAIAATEELWRPELVRHVRTFLSSLDCADALI